MRPGRRRRPKSRASPMSTPESADATSSPGVACRHWGVASRCALARSRVYSSWTLFIPIVSRQRRSDGRVLVSPRHQETCLAVVRSSIAPHPPSVPHDAAVAAAKRKCTSSARQANMDGVSTTHTKRRTDRLVFPVSALPKCPSKSFRPASECECAGCMLL